MLTMKIFRHSTEGIITGLFSYNPQKYIREKFILSDPQKFPPLKLIHYTVFDSNILQQTFPLYGRLIHSLFADCSNRIFDCVYCILPG